MTDLHQTHIVRFFSGGAVLLLLLTATLQSQGQDVQRPDYWIVSSRHCPQKGKQAACRLNYMRMGPNQFARQSNIQEFHQSLQPGVPVCIIAHGSFMNQRELPFETEQMFRWLRSAAPEHPMHVVFFTWPSESPFIMVPQLNVAILGRRAAYNGSYVARLISQIPKNRPISLIGHSHGARTIAAAMHLLGGGDVQGLRNCGVSGHRIRVLLLAAAIDNHWLNPGERYGMALCRAESMLIARNRKDLVLGIYPLRRLFSHESLAHAGLARKNLAMMGGHAAKLSELDVTSLIGHGHYWHHYYRLPEIARAVAPFLYYRDANNDFNSGIFQRGGAPAQAFRQMSPKQPSRNPNRRPVFNAPLRETFSNFKRTVSANRF